MPGQMFRQVRAKPVIGAQNVTDADDRCFLVD
jgi:hypothetical protein